MSGNDSSELDSELDQLLVDDLVEATTETDSETGELSDLTPGGIVESQNAAKQVIDKELEKLSAALEIDQSTRITAKSLYDQYHKSADLNGNALEMIAAACLYTACKVESVPLTPDEFASVEGTVITKKILLRRTKTIASSLGLDARAFINLSHYVTRFCEELHLDEAIADRAQEIVDAAEEEGIAGGKSPSGWAAAAIYNANREAGKLVTQSDIAEVAGVSEVTIRNRYKEQQEKLDIIREDHTNPDLGQSDNENSNVTNPSGTQSETPDDIRKDTQVNLSNWDNIEDYQNDI
jgi:transcription initiation factor TFIIB